MMTGLQLINEIEDRLGWPQTTSLEGAIPKTTRKMVRLLNRVLSNMVALADWPMLKHGGTLITEAGLEFQNVRLDLTAGSNTVTISTFDLSEDTDDDGVGDTRLAPFLQKHRIWAIQFGTQDTPVYRVTKILDPYTVELNRVWVGDTIAPTGDSEDITLTITMAMDQYALPEDFDRPTGDWEDFLSIYKVQPRGDEEFLTARRNSGRIINTGDPSIYTVFGLDPTETYQVLHLHPWPDKQTFMEYTYQRMHPAIALDVDRVLFPQTQLGVIIEACIYLSDRDYQDDTRMQAALQEYMQQFKAVKGKDTVVTDSRQLTPRIINRARSVRHRRRGGVRYDYGDTFDIAGMVDLPK